MLSVMNQPAAPVLDVHPPQENVSLNELVSMRDAVPQAVQLLRRSGGRVRLHCAVPTCCDGDETIDLHDLHEMRTRCLSFLGELMTALRSSGVPASYRLAPSSCPCCMVCCVPDTGDAAQIRHDALEAVSAAKYSRQKVLLADLKSGPAIIFT